MRKSSRWKILVVEDDLALAVTIRKILGVNEDVETAHSLEEARRMAVSSKYDVFLLDLGLPDGNGADLISEIRNYPYRATTIVMTAEDDIHVVRKCIDLGTDDYIIKSENLISDILLRIPLAIERAELRSRSDLARKMPELALPSNLDEITETRFNETMNSVEKAFLSSAIELCGGDTASLAERIGYSRSTIMKKMMSFGIPRRSWSRRTDGVDNTELVD